MRLFKKSSIGKIVKVAYGLLQDKYVMIVAEYKEGYGVIADSSDWPSLVPPEYNALFVAFDDVKDITEEEQTLLKVKFPHPDQFK